jgi:hypothetical protein
MTVTEAPPVADVPRPAPPTRRWRVIAAISAVVAVVAIAVAAFALIRDDGNSSASIATRDITATRQAQQACQQWFDQSGAATSATPGWCGYMGDWMYQQMASGRMGSMMWGNPTAMYNTCVTAMGSYQPQVSDPATWCRNMVDWMRDHLSDGDWGGWMMNPSMMGR